MSEHKSKFIANVQHKPIERELQHAYMSYAMSVIVSRALPDVRDGLKPVHRRVLYAMHLLSNYHNQPFKRSSRVTGEVTGKFHPHGDVAVYDAIVRMIQEFNSRYPLLEGQGNFGSIDGDSAAASRYTGVRIAQFGALMLAEIEKNTVDFVPNYDETEMQPSVLPAKVPNILLNGTSGIAVGMATNIAPFHLGELIDCVLAYMHDSNVDIEQLIELMPGPDFPTKGIVFTDQIRNIYEHGKGAVTIRGKYHLEDNKLIITELPFQVNKADLVTDIANLIIAKKINATKVQDESSKGGLRVVINLASNSQHDLLVKELYKSTQLQSTFHVNQVMLVKNTPKQLGLKTILSHFLEFRYQTVVRQMSYELEKDKNRLHIVDGLIIGMEFIDKVIDLVKQDNSKLAVQALTSYEFGNKYLSEIQAKAIMEMRISRLVKLEAQNLHKEKEELVHRIDCHTLALSDRGRILDIISNELKNIKEQYAGPRLSMISDQAYDIAEEDLVINQELLISFSSSGYINCQPLANYNAQNRGGQGKYGATLKAEDMIAEIILANSKDLLLAFSNLGRVYWIKAYKLPFMARQSKGKPIHNFFNLKEGEIITNLLPVTDQNKDLLFVSTKGKVKRCEFHLFSRPRSTGIQACTLEEGDSIQSVLLIGKESQVMLFNSSGMAIRFDVKDIRTVGRAAIGVQGMRLSAEDIIVSAIELEQEEQTIGICTSVGKCKISKANTYRKTKRGAKGVRAISTTGVVIGAGITSKDTDIITSTDQGRIIRVSCNQIPIQGRTASGIILTRLSEQEILQTMKIVANEPNQENLINQDIIQDV